MSQKSYAIPGVIFLPFFCATLLKRVDSLVLTNGKWEDVDQEMLNSKQIIYIQNHNKRTKSNEYGHRVCIPADMYEGDPDDIEAKQVLIDTIQKELSRLFDECSKHFRESIRVNVQLPGWDGLRLTVTGTCPTTDSPEAQAAKLFGDEEVAQDEHEFDTRSAYDYFA